MMQSYYILLKQQGAFGEKFAEEWLFIWLLVFIGQKKRQSYRLACLWVWKNEGVHDYFELLMLE